MAQQKLKHILLLISSFVIFHSSFSQEFNCQVDVNCQQISTTDNLRIFATMKRQVFEFMNNTRFTLDKFEQNERIDCSILINVTSDLGGGTYTGDITVQSERGIFKAGIRTPLFNYEDKSFGFNYIEQQPFDQNFLQGFTDNISSVLAYYAYVMLAMDYDSYGLLGGTENWKKAFTIVNNAQTSGQVGWQSSDNNFKNRFVYVDNILNNTMFQPLRESIYNYHRKGLDQMYDKIDEGRAAVLQALNNINEVHKNRPGSMNVQLFFEAKNQEIVNIFQGAPLEEKNQVIQTLSIIDAANTTIYSKILQQ